MQVLAHTGPNWNPGALDVSQQHRLIAIGSRNTVLLYNYEGQFAAELRAVGRGRVTALRFCRSPTLTHLLIVGTSNGFVRIFDVLARRIFRKVCEPAIASCHGSVFALRFVQRFPNVVLVASSPNKLACWRYENAGELRNLVDERLEFRDMLSVNNVPGYPSLIMVAGVCPHDANVGIVSVVDLASNGTTQVIHRGELIYEVTMTVITPYAMDRQAKKNKCVAAALSSPLQRYPLIYRTTDGLHWNMCRSRQRQPDPEVDSTSGERNATRNGGRLAVYRCSATWQQQNVLLSSDQRGTILLWKVLNDGRVVRSASRQSAHMRQVFAMVPLCSGNSFVSISMDRTLAAWVVTGLETPFPKIVLKWRSLRTSGPVKTLAVSRLVGNIPKDSNASVKDPEDEHTVLSFCCDDNVVTCLDLCSKTSSYSMIGEALPLGSMTGKRKRESINHLAPCVLTPNGVLTEKGQESNLAVFADTQGRLGILKLLDGQLEFLCSKRRKGNSTLRITALNCNARSIISVAKNGELNRWVLPNSSELRKEYKSSSLQSQTRLLISNRGEQLRSITASSAVQAQGGGKYFLIGYAGGLVALFSILGKLLLQPICTGMSEVTSISYLEASRVVAIADTEGSVGIFTLDVALFDRDGPSCENSLDPTVDIYKVRSERIASIQWSPDTCAFSGNGKAFQHYLSIVSGRCGVSVWAHSVDVGLQLCAELKGHSGTVSSAAWTSERILLTTGADGTIREWNVEKQPKPPSSANNCPDLRLTTSKTTSV